MNISDKGLFIMPLYNNLRIWEVSSYQKYIQKSYANVEVWGNVKRLFGDKGVKIILKGVGQWQR